ncbi:antigen 5 like allergen Cul n 1-like [Teleopsis dalmanni]|uniref:antigen 5 like allergen Cul n 1-like n=1 Tax=Teleopsis dalmanni TaxID=139649 RepID=UPI0018CDC2BD|nr:antigen 5 like allergen Cul n 1-like [Teleopsis dalmanni]
MHYKRFLQLFGIFFVIIGECTSDYCDRTKLCLSQGDHIACGNDGSFSSNCKGKCELVDMAPYQSDILHYHNSYRNDIAGGNLKCFPPAARMPVVKWDPELSYIAGFNVKTCVFAHDNCRSTYNYTYSGQNIFYILTTRLTLLVGDMIANAIDLWYNEYFYADYKLLMKYNKTTPQTGHFTTLVCDRQVAVGCACLKSVYVDTNNRTKLFYIFTCNYASTNIRNYATYQFGEPGSMCKMPSSTYPNLCDDNDIDANNFRWYSF